MKTKVMSRIHRFCYLLILMIPVGCAHHQELSDAYGNFEATERLISSKAAGQLLWFTLEQGQLLAENDTVGLVDTSALSLKRATLKASMKTVLAKVSGLSAGKKVLEQQLRNLKVEQNRIQSLFNDGAATQQQLDDINGNVKVLNLKKEEITVQQQSVLVELDVIRSQIASVEEQIDNCYIVNPVPGTVLEKYSENGEMVAPGKFLYKLADLSNMFLTVYVDETMLPGIGIGDQAQVLMDRPGGGLDSLSGTISWVSGEAEFTPKIIQTRKERVNMVYAVKIRVKNDGRLKIGMPGEANFSISEE
jgi:HlyD family secretion protein